MLRSIGATRAPLVLRTLAQATADGESHVVRAFLLQPDVTRVIVGELDDQRARVLGKLRRNLFDELLLTLNVDRSEQLVFVDRLQQLLVFLLALVFSIGKRRDVPQLAIELQLLGTAFGELQQLL